MFDASSDNEKIKHIYGNYGFWSWLKYWYIDSSNQVLMMLYDKGYFDYDYEHVEHPEDVTKWEDTIMSKEEVEKKLSMFGIGKNKDARMSLEEIQEHVIKNI